MESSFSTTADIVNSFGLSFDIVEALLLFKYGLPSPYRKSGDKLLYEESEASENEMNKKIKRRAIEDLHCSLLDSSFN
jgi:hypothetical protein